MARPTLLRTEGEYPPGSFIFSDPITGKKYTDTHTTFKQRVEQVIRDRSANARLIRDATRLGFDTVAQELSEQTCERLNYDSRFCGVNGVPIPPVEAPNLNPIRPGMSCLKCSATQLEPIKCKTCGGSGRTTGWKCKVCGHEHLF